jgi:hypothetical protein
MRLKWLSHVVVAAMLGLAVLVQSLPAQDSEPSGSTTTFYVDRKTGQVFVRPGRGRVPLVIGGAIDSHAIERHIEDKTRDQFRAAVAETQAQERVDQTAMQTQVDQMRPAWQSYMANFQNKFRLGALAYLDYSAYPETGFGPQQLENINPPGPGNKGFNSFDITRVYLNTYFTPTDDVVFRFTPEIYRANGGATADRTGTTTGFASNLDGNLGVRLKYAYVQYKGLFDDVEMFKGGNTTLGAQPNPFIPWEEDMYQYRFVNLVPWNYMGFSSSQIGLQQDGPIKPFGAESTYAEYGFGVYDEGNFHAPNQSNWPQVMGRLTVYPFGARWRYDGLGATGFVNYGWGNSAADSEGLTSPLKASTANFERIAALLHYNAEQWNIAGEFDYGKNAFQLSNMFSGSGPLDVFGTATGPAITKGTPAAQVFSGNPGCSATKPCYNAFASFGPQTAVYQAFLNNGRARQVGFDFFGHYHIPGTKLSAFGMFQWLMPNDNVGQNPLDFQRFIAGISYQYNEYLRFALDSQNLLFYHDQFGIPVSKAARFNFIPGSTLNGRLLPSTGSFVIPNLVPRDQHAIFLNMEFAY